MLHTVTYLIHCSIRLFLHSRLYQTISYFLLLQYDIRFSYITIYCIVLYYTLRDGIVFLFRLSSIPLYDITCYFLVYYIILYYNYVWVFYLLSITIHHTALCFIMLYVHVCIYICITCASTFSQRPKPQTNAALAPCGGASSAGPKLGASWVGTVKLLI